ncbi:MAG TPA: Mrp/NBP35 family ATP-binding protein [Syntrophobacter fumaroxidans]|nr:Mrp/NBP35 family ATP-binding protein [Syntrophobacter fumaroxidans]
METGETNVGNACDHAHHEEAGEEIIKVRERLSHIRHKLIVMSGKGGVGKSSVAAYLAIGLGRLGNRVGLLDVDFHGPSIPRMLGISGMFRFSEKEQALMPHEYEDHLKVVSIECLLEDRDAAVIWRGPMKHGVIRQFISEVDWGELDYLVIDSPPGTGDEPLSVAQTIEGTRAVIVTTPQEIALADVRKSINFCHHLAMPIVGLVENMSGYVCPHCMQESPLFGRGGGRRTAEQMNVHFLGALPFDPRLVEASDLGHTLTEREKASPFTLALSNFVSEVIQRSEALAEEQHP